MDAVVDGQLSSASSSSEPPSSLSENVEQLPLLDKERYVNKLGNIGTCNPYLIPASCCTPLLKSNLLPKLEFPDIYKYLINFPSSYTGEAMKAYKSLDGYKYFIAGKVNHLLVWHQPMKRDPTTSVFVILSKVHHSQRLNDPPVKVWVAIQEDGVVITAHCTCMAGVTEVCSHVAATLFAVSKGVEMSTTTCTSKPCTWIKPAKSRSSGDDMYAEASNINFSKPKRRMTETPTTLPKSSCKSRSVPPPSKDETDNFFQQLKGTGVPSAILSLVPAYAADFIPKALQLKLPEPLTKLYCAENLKVSYPQLLTKCGA
ncbi:uncharacterized protein LOC119733881, partial [Patiria miniata]|uniref:SWIM-type domain-containing protein n=1 Tax=Patiria miniata TaxID=46514 RepID=A0A914AHH1_PATMI